MPISTLEEIPHPDSSKDEHFQRANLPNIASLAHFFFVPGQVKCFAPGSPRKSEELWEGLTCFVTHT
jgi:hypothetical protein